MLANISQLESLQSNHGHNACTMSIFNEGSFNQDLTSIKGVTPKLIATLSQISDSVGRMMDDIRDDEISVSERVKENIESLLFVTLDMAHALRSIELWRANEISEGSAVKKRKEIQEDEARKQRNEATLDRMRTERVNP